MSVEHNWEVPESLQAYLGSELNSLADGANKLGGVIAVSSSKPEKFLNLALNLAAQASARDAGARVDVYWLSSLDGGTTYCYGDDSTDPPASALLWSFDLDASAAARYVTIEDLEIPPFPGKLLVTNETGQPFAASGNTLEYCRHSEQST